jgi:hypothetical protein
MVAELARVRFFVAALKSGDSSYPKIKLVQSARQSPRIGIDTYPSFLDESCVPTLRFER